MTAHFEASDESGNRGGQIKPFTAGAGYWTREFTPPGTIMETPEQQKARYEFYKSIFKDIDVLAMLFLSLLAVLGFALTLVIILSMSGVFTGN